MFKTTIEFNLQNGREYTAVLYVTKSAKVAPLIQGKAVADGKQIMEVGESRLRIGIYLIPLQTREDASIIALLPIK